MELATNKTGHINVVDATSSFHIQPPVS